MYKGNLIHGFEQLIKKESTGYFVKHGQPVETRGSVL